MNKKEKRYVVSIDMYVYADNDYDARKKAHNIAEAIEEETTAHQPKVLEIGEQPFARLAYRKLEDISNPAIESIDEALKKIAALNCE